MLAAVISLTGCYQDGPSAAPANIGSEPPATPREVPVPATRRHPTRPAIPCPPLAPRSPPLAPVRRYTSGRATCAGVSLGITRDHPPRSWLRTPQSMSDWTQCCASTGACDPLNPLRPLNSNSMTGGLPSGVGGDCPPSHRCSCTSVNLTGADHRLALGVNRLTPPGPGPSWQIAKLTKTLREIEYSTHHIHPPDVHSRP